MSSRHLKVSNVFDSLITAGNSFQIVAAEKLKERLLKLVVQKGIGKRFWLAEQRQRDGLLGDGLLGGPLWRSCFYFSSAFNLFLSSYLSFPSLV